MQKWRFILLVVISGCAWGIPSLNAQETNADSLFAIWSDTTNNSAERVEAFYQRFAVMYEELWQRRGGWYNPETERWLMQAPQAVRLAKHLFLANMNHEIRTPMNAIKGMTDILIRRGPKDTQKEFLQGIKQSSDSLLVIINDILDISKIESGKVDLEEIPFRLEEVLQGVQTIMQLKAEEKGLELKTDAIESVEVELAENGAIALEKVRSGDYDLILMDLQMPVMNGYEATEKIRNLANGKSRIPTIAMTVNVMKEEVERCFEMGMDDFIGKPFDTEELISKIHKLVSISTPEKTDP